MNNLKIVVVLGKEGVSVAVEERYLDPELRKKAPNCRFEQGVGFYVVAVLAEPVEILPEVFKLKKLSSFRIETLQVEGRVEAFSPVKELELGEKYLIEEGKKLLIRRFEGFNSRQFSALNSDDENVKKICLLTSGTKV